VRHLPSVEMRKTEERGRARKSARGRFEERIRGDRRVSHFVPRAGVILLSARFDIISYTREKNFGMIENSLDLTERRGRPWLEMRK